MDSHIIDLTVDAEDDTVEIPRIHVVDDDDVELPEDDDCRELTLNEIRDLEARSADPTTGLSAEYERIEPTLSSSGIICHEGLDVELPDEFMRIVDVVRHLATGEIFIRGILCLRVRTVNNYFKKNRNEVCAMLKSEENCPDPGLSSSLTLRPLDSVIQVRKIIFTNQNFPALSFRDNGRRYMRGRDEQLIEETEILVCRWKFTEYVSLRDKRVVSGAVQQISEAEADVGKGVSDVVKKHRWIGDDSSDTEATNPKSRSTLNTRTTPKRSPNPIHASSSPTREPPRRPLARPTRRYCDICAGAGGMARGAHEAGLSLNLLLDHWKTACETLEENWPGKSVQKDIYTFCIETDSGRTWRFEVMHISFPCQPYAACHTVPGKNDDANSAAGYSVIELLSKTRPRVVTFEQTPTFLTRHTESFNALIHQLTVMGYNVRWKILTCSEYGNVQARKRLFLIASCPGEPLPPFPKQTNGPGRKPEVTIRDRLRLLPRRIQQHMLQFTRKTTRQPSYDPNTPLHHTITCNGGESDVHPEGDRTFNMQELALLAGFPPEHKFANTGKTNLRRMIGNAIPAMVAKLIFDEVQKSMDAADDVVRNYKKEVVDLSDL